MATYVILIPGDADTWERQSADEKERGYAKYTEFEEALAARGHTVTGGAELRHPREAKHLRAGEAAVTDGPFAETVEQLTGFYQVDSDDPDDLAECCRIIVGTGGANVEIRGVITQAEREAEQQAR